MAVKHPAGWILTQDCATEGLVRKMSKQRCSLSCLACLFPASALALVQLIRCSARVLPEHSAFFTAHSVWGRDVVPPCGRYQLQINTDCTEKKMVCVSEDAFNAIKYSSLLSMGFLFFPEGTMNFKFNVSVATSRTQVFATIEAKCATSRIGGRIQHPFCHRVLPCQLELQCVPLKLFVQ